MSDTKTVEARVLEVVSKQFPGQQGISGDTKITEVGTEADLVEIISALEDAFGHEMNTDGTGLETVNDLVAHVASQLPS